VKESDQRHALAVFTFVESVISMQLVPSKLAEAVMRLTFIWEAPDWNLGQETLQMNSVLAIHPTIECCIVRDTNSIVNQITSKIKIAVQVYHC
jgi:hypothetical protein